MIPIPKAAVAAAMLAFAAASIPAMAQSSQRTSAPKNAPLTSIAMPGTPAHAMSAKKRRAYEDAARASAAEARAWNGYVRRIDQISGAIKGVDTAARIASRSRNPAVKASGLAYRGGRAAGTAGVWAVKKLRK